MNKVSLTSRKISKVMAIDPAPNNCGIVFLERTNREGVKGFDVHARFTANIGKIEEAKGNSDWYWPSRVIELIKDLSSWFEQADMIVIERQFVAPNSFNRLPSYHVQQALVSSLMALYGAEKVSLVDSRSVKSVYFKEDERTSYEKRKSTAEDLCREELLKAPVFRPDDRLHDQADAYLVACYWYNHVYKTPFKRNTVKVGRPRKVEDESEVATESEEYIPPKSTRGRKRKSNLIEK